MAQLRVIRGGEEAVAVAVDEMPVPVALLNADPSRINEIPPMQKLAQPRYSKSSDVSANTNLQEYGRYSMQSATKDDLRDSFAQDITANTVGVVSLRNEVGTTTITAHLAALMASYRPGGIAAIDADKTVSALSWQLAGQAAPDFHVTPAALKNRETMSAQALPTTSRVEVFGILEDEDDNLTNRVAYASALRHHFDTVLIDTPSKSNSIEGDVLLSLTQVILIVTGPNQEGARLAEQMLELLVADGHSPHDIVIVVNGVPKSGGRKFISQLQQQFASRVGAVVLMPLVETGFTEQNGRAVDVERLPQKWRESLENLANVMMNRLKAHAIFDVTDEEQVSHQGAELRVLPTVSNHDDAISLQGNTSSVISRVGSLGPFAPTPGVATRSNKKGDT